MAIKINVAYLKRRGFDQSTRSGKYLTPKCSQCQALVIQGVATHEHGCPNLRASITYLQRGG